MIDYQALNALYCVVTEKGFERAAKKLHLTQSAISRRIHQLESNMGEPVVIRSQPPKPTALGKRLLNHFQQVQQLEVALDIQGTKEGTVSSKPLTVRLAANADSLATWLPEALAVPHSQSHCAFRYEILTEDQSIALRRMKAGEVMVCVCDNPVPVNGGNVEPLGALRYQIIASPDFVKRYNYTSPDELSALPCLVFDEHDQLQHDYLKRINGSSPEYTHYCPSSEGFKQAMIAGLGFGLLPELQLGNSLKTGELVNLVPESFVDVPLYWHYWQTESPQLKTLRAYALTVAKHYLIHD